MISSESHNGRVRCNRGKRFQLRGERAQRNANRWSCQQKYGVPLPEPTDDRETLAAGHWQNFVKRLGGECDQQTSFAFETKGHGVIGGIVKIQNTTAETSCSRFDRVVVQENYDRDPPDAQVAEVELPRVAVLVTHKEVALFVT